MALPELTPLSAPPGETNLQRQSEAAQAELDRQRIARQKAAVMQQNEEYDSIFDRFWFDDFSTVPVIGPMASATARGVTDFYDAVGDEYSYFASNITGAGLTREQARDVTVGQIFESRISGDNILNPTVRQAKWGPTNLNILDEDFNVDWTSGLIDTTVMFFLDPLVLLGKATKVARLGTNFGRSGRAIEKVTGMPRNSLAFSGLTSKRMNIAGPQVTRMATSQIEAARMGANNRASVLADEIVNGSYDDLTNLYEFRGAYRDVLAETGARINNREDALNFLGASLGDPSYIKRLQDTRSDLFVQMLRASAPDQYEMLALQAGASEIPALFARPLEAAVNPDNLVAQMRANDSVFDDLLKSLELDEAVAGIDNAVMLAEDSFQPIQRWGQNNAKAARIAAAWRRGKGSRATNTRKNRARKRDLDQARNQGKITPDEYEELLLDVGRTGTQPLMHETVYRASSYLPKVRMWTWIKGSRAAGMIDVRGYEVGHSSDEMRAALSDSKILRDDPQFTTEMMNRWGNSAGGSERFTAVKEIEVRSFQRMYAAELAKKNAKEQKKAADLYGKGRIDQAEYQRRLADNPTTLDPDDLPGKDLLDEAYRLIDERRADSIEKIRSGRAYLVDEKGDLIRVDPRLRSQLETKVPMLDMSVMEQTAKILVKFADEKDPLMAAGRDFARKRRGAIYKGGLDTAVSLWKASVLMRLGYTQRNVAEGWLRSMASIGLLPMLSRIPAWSVNFPTNAGRWSNRRVNGKRLLKREEQLIDDLVQQQRGIDEFIEQGVKANDPQMVAMKEALEQQKARIAEIRARRKKMQTKKRATARRKIGDREYEAFGGPEGPVLRELASMGQTNQQFLESSLMREQDLVLNARNYTRVNPTDPQYYDELNQAVIQFQGDPLMQQMLKAIAAGKANPMDDALDWARSGDAAFWRRDMRIKRNEIEGHVVDVESMLFRYLPTEEARRLVATQSEPSALALREAIQPNLQGYDDMLTAIHGREAREILRPASLGEYARKPIDTIFKWLGNIPETGLVRHPYFASVWSREFDSMVGIAQRQGVDLSEDVLNRINKTAQTRALRDLKDTLYTIERLSNPAAFFRFLVPFFPAWENSLKVWSRMIVNDPSIAARASILWNIPNQLGMVVDSEGKPVESDRMDFLTGSQEKYIRLPSGINDWLSENVTGGIPVAIPQGAINVVTPGETPFLPGFGPVVQVPVSVFMQGKPDLQRTLRDQLPEPIYNQIAPFGVIPSPTDAILPSFARKVNQWRKGEDDRMYLGIADSMMQSAFVDWYADGGNPADMPDVGEIMDQTNQFYRFSILASLVAPFATTRTSKYQFQQDAWRQLMADPNMTYRQKVDTFVEKFGTAFLPMIESTTQKVSPTVGYTIESFDVIDNNRTLVSEIATRTDPRAIGVLTAGTQAAEFDQGVYKYWTMEKVPGTAEEFSRRLTPAEMQVELLMSQAWREYRKEKEARDDALAMMGVSIQANAAAAVKEKWDNFVNVQMPQKYGETWNAQYRMYLDMTPSYLIGIDKALNDENFMDTQGQSPLWGHISNYMRERQLAQRAIADGADSAAVREQFAAWAADYRLVSLEFADFYDNFLEQDNLTVPLGESGE